MPKYPNPEYFLRIEPHVDDRSGKQGHLLKLTSVKEFRTFLYDIKADVTIEADVIRVVIQGLSAPQITIPEHGPARFNTVLYNLKGTYTLSVSKYNGPENIFTVHFTPSKTIQKKPKPKKVFVKLETTDTE